MSQQRQLAAIMFTDIVGYTALMSHDEQKTFDYLNQNRQLQKPIIEQHNGRWIKELGDGVMASFPTVSDSVNAAIKIQEAVSASQPYQLRIGLHQGEVIFDSDDVFGDAVNIAARIQTAAVPGSIYVSESVHQNVSNKQGIATKFVKEAALKNVKDPVKIYEVMVGKNKLSMVKKEQVPAAHNSIAVLPFTNMSSDPEQEFFSDGISEEITNMLAQVPGLKVAGRISAFSFKGKHHDLRQIGRELNVNYILEGSVRTSGKKLRVTAQLIKVSDGFHLWSEKFDRELEDIFDIQDEISLAILNAIKIKLLGAEKDVVLKRYTDNPEVYQMYLQGRYHYHKWTGADELTKAIEYYQKALQIETNYAIAYSGMASCYLNLWIYNYWPAEKCLPQMIEAAERALRLDDQIAETHTAIARKKMWYEWDMPGAEAEFRRALELNENIAEIHEQLAYCLSFLGKKEAALQHADIAYNLDPFSLMTNYHAGIIYWMNGEYDKGIAQGRRTKTLEPHFYGGPYILALIYSIQKKYSKAIQNCEHAVKVNPSSHTLSLMGMIHGLIGNKDKATEIAKGIQKLKAENAAGHFDLGLVFSGLGEYEKATEHFTAGVDNEEGLMLYLKYILPYFEGLQNYSGISDILKRIGLPDAGESQDQLQAVA